MMVLVGAVLVLGLAGAASAGYRLVCDETLDVELMDLTSPQDVWEVCPTGVLNCTGSGSVEQRICGGGQLIVNGGTVNVADRFNHDGGDIIINQGGSVRVNGDYKFPDTGGPCRLILNDGVFSCNNCENFVDRDSLIIVGYGKMLLDSTSGDRHNPRDWLNQGGIVPAEGFGPIIIRSVGGKTEISATIIPKITFDLEASGDFESVSPAGLTVNVVDAKNEAYTVNYAVTGGTAVADEDYVLSAGSLTFSAGQTSKDIIVTIVDDGVDEDDETIIVTLSNPSGGGAVLGSIKQHTYTIIDPRPAVQFDTDSSEALENISPHDITVSLSTPAEVTVTVDYHVTGGTATVGVDYGFLPGTFTFSPGETTKTLDIQPIDDGVREMPETIVLTLSNPDPSNKLRLGSQSQHTVMLRDPWAKIVYEVFKVDIGCPGNETTYKDGWIPFEGTQWCDGQPHDGRGLSDVGGTGINVDIDSVPGSGNVNVLAAGGDPIAGTAFQDVTGGTGDPGGSLFIRLSGQGLVATEYWLYTYHNWGDLLNMPSIKATGEGVVQVEPVTDVPIQSVSSDDELIPSVVKFYADGSGPVTITYEAEFDSKTVINAFRLCSAVRPALASNPSPDDKANNVSPDVALEWVAGEGAVSHDVYLGTDETAMANATTSSGEFVCNQTETIYDPPGLLDFGQTYYWRIDEIGDTTLAGDIWSFPVDSGKARDPKPVDDGKLISGDILQWSAGALAMSHDVYFGTNEAAVANATTASNEYKGNQSTTSYNPPPLQEGTTYFWRIDEVGQTTFVEGDVWSFQAAGRVYLRVDLAHPVSGSSTQPRPGTLKEGWYPFVASRWYDMYAHDCVWEKDAQDPAGISGSGVHAMLSCGYEGQGGLHVKGMCRCNLAGDCAPTGSPIGDPIANSWYYGVDWVGPQAGDIVLILTDLPAGAYELTSYHNYWEPGPGQSNRNCCDCVTDRPPIPSITVHPLPVAGKPPGKDNYSGLCLLGTGVGVMPIEDAYNVPVTATLDDDEVSKSRVVFETNGLEVLVIYEAQDYHFLDCARPARFGGRGILNAFELELLEAPGCPCLGDLAAPAGQVDLQDLDAMVNMLVAAGPPFIVPVEPGHCGDMAQPTGQVDLQDLDAMVNLLVNAGPPFIVPCE